MRNLVKRVGHRGVSLLFFALLDMVYSFSLFDPPDDGRTNPTLIFVATVAPLFVWAIIWLVAGIICLINAFKVNDRWGFTTAISIKVLWGILYVYGWIIGVERAYLSAAIWLCLAAWVAIISSWPEPKET